MAGKIMKGSKTKTYSFLCGLVMALLVSVYPSSKAFAICVGCPTCTLCYVEGGAPPNPPTPQRAIEEDHAIGKPRIMTFISNEFTQFRRWWWQVFLPRKMMPALFVMAEQLSAVGMYQVEAIGMLLDAKQQLETQRLLQQLQAEAHRDYHPSEDFCWLGTNARSLASSESRGKMNTLALGERALSRHLGKASVSGSVNQDEDLLVRWQRFTEHYCDPRDNAWAAAAASGLELACPGGSATEGHRLNRDIDYTRFIEESRTIDADFTNGNLSGNGDEEDVLAMANNLFGSSVLTRQANSTFLQNKQVQHYYLALRSVAAKRSVAENSYNSIVGLKSAGTPDAAVRTREFLAAVMKELGYPDSELQEMIGEDPSYYAQLEVLAKKIYQNPDFLGYLYDKPANVARKAVALKAIEIMLERAMHESEMRQEMLLSVLLSANLNDDFREVNRNLTGIRQAGK